MSVSDGSTTSTTEDEARHRDGYAAIERSTPQWLLATTPEARRGLRQQAPQAMPWFTAALADMPDVVARLQDDYREHAALARQVDGWMAALPDPRSFAEALLGTALKARFGRDIDVHRTWLFLPRRMHADDSFLTASRDWMVESFKAFRLACRPLLDVALQNFEAWESEAGGLDLPVTKADIFSVSPGKPLWQGESLGIDPEAFVALCRDLDLGRRYQERIMQTFEVRADEALGVGERARVFERHEQTGLLLHLHLARMQGLVCQALYQAIHERLHGREGTFAGVAVKGGSLTLWQVELGGIVVFGADRAVSTAPEAVVVYIPGDPETPLREFPSFNDFSGYLRDRLLQDDYLQFFQRFLPLRQRARVLEKLRQAFNPKVWNAGGWYEEQLDRQASLPFREGVLDEALMPALLRRKIAGLKDDGLFLAVPTAVQDHKTLEEKLEYFAQAGLLGLNVLSFAVPLVGAAMMLFTAVQLAHEVYEGIGAWTRDEHDQAWAYLLDVVENLALMAALGSVATPRPATPPRDLPALPAALHPVRLGNGQTRLWTGDLGAFAHDIVLPASLAPDARGLYAYRGKQWLALEGRRYALVEGDDGRAYLEHPWRKDAYRPIVRHQGGVWLRETDQPRQWSGLELFQRLGVAAEGLDERSARQLLVISGCHESMLRRALVDGQRPPALLLDSLERQRIYHSLEENGETLSREHHARLFDMLYQAPGLPPGASQQVIQREFGGLPRRLVEELLEHATTQERNLLVDERRVPSRLAEEARLYLQSVRLARAYEGLYLPKASNNDSTRLALHSLAALPGWAEQYRVEIRGLRTNGPLLDSIGPLPAVHQRVLVKDADGYRTAEEPDVAADDLFNVVLRTLTSVQREALGIGPRASGIELRRKVLDHPLERPALRKVLRMQEIRPAMRSPMRLANGRPGYPLSGRPRLTPLLSENTLLDKIHLLELPDIFPADLLQQLRAAHLDNAAIDARLDTLLDEHEQLRRKLPLGESPRQSTESGTVLNDRHLIELALWQHWRDNLLPEIGRSGVPLRLFAVSLEAFPGELPAFFRVRVQALELAGVAVPPGFMAPDEEGLLRLDDPLLRLLRSFPRVTALEIDALEGRSPVDLPRLVVGAYPQLAELRLLNLHLPVGQEVLDELCRLGELRHLDLSGNRLSHLPVSLTGSLQLDFLGLDRLGLEHWPEWLDNDALDGIARISLRDNRLTELPAQLRSNPGTAEHTTLICLDGNLFSHQALISLRISAWHGRRFRFELSIPQTVENIVEGMMIEQETLSGSIKHWLDSLHDAGSVSAERLAARRALGDTLLTGWTAQTDGSATRSLRLEDVRVEDFPQTLPAFYFNRISRLELIRPVGGVTRLDGLIARFSRLEHLTIAGCPLAQLPASLAQLVELRHLTLTDTQLLVDQGVIDALSRMTGLTTLELGGNRLGEIGDVSAFSQLFLNLLGLERMEITRWPAWLDRLLPARVQWLNLNHNRLATLPRYLLENAESASGNTEISLEGNPLSEEIMHSAHLSEGLSRPYTFRLDLPEHLRRLGDSWRGSSSGGGSSTAHSEAELLHVDIWLEKAGTASESRRQLWRHLEVAGDADDLLRLVGRLRYTAEYRNDQTRPDLVERVWQVLNICAQDGELRLVLNGMAEEPLRQLRDFDTCPDGIRLEFNQMEILVFTGQALRAVSDEARGPTLYRLMCRLYRLQELDNIARREAGDRDEAEVRLAYRLNLANQLDLPLAPEQMLYAGSANLHAGELERVVTRVREGERGQGLLDYAAQRDFWLGYLRDVHAVRFKALRDTFEADVLGIYDQYPEDTPVQSSERIQGLIERVKVDEGKLIRELTQRMGLQLDKG